ncbi:pentatricopeptide repeat-containing protein At4g21065-like [Carica papaya]|uniref:pentatricopeptide repeat-containing protein At4g21065-like n=1 Tax=Carica papaya TaxID=3649 RepID=UPI000B8D0C5E|nr:pentatricopeptide repeat-containing protein At4g21065-like [Carica papaya]
MRRACLAPQFCSITDLLLFFRTHADLLSSLSIIAPIAYMPHLQVRQKLWYNYHSLSMGGEEDAIAIENHHAIAIKDGSLQNLHVGNHLLASYVMYHQFDHARKLFDEIPARDIRTWTTLITGFSRIGCSILGLQLFREMQIQGVCPNQFILSSVLKSCSGLRETRTGKEIHGWIVRNCMDVDVVLKNSILDLYVKCRAFDHASRWFELMKERDSVSWNVMLAAYLHIGEVGKSLDLFRSFPLKDVVTWNTVIDGLIKNGFERTALGLLYQMVQNGLLFNKATFSIALVLVASLSILELGKQIHARILRLRVPIDGFIRNSLIHMYCRCGKMGNASVVFERISPDFLRPEDSKISCNELVAAAISWSSIVTGYVQNGDYAYALQTFISMVDENIEVDKYTITSIISACANSGTLEFARQIHAYVQKIGHEMDAHLRSSLIDMYAKCGCLDDSWTIFGQTNDHNIVLWTSMISAFALHGYGKEAINLFKCMIDERITVPNEVTFVAVLTACSHGRLPEEGCKYFRLMTEVYGIKPKVEHFTCMVDMYGRCGLFNEIKEFIHKHGLSHLTAIWKSFLSSCRLHKDTEMAKWVSEKLLQLEPFDAGPYILLSNTYATEHKWEKAAKVRSLMNNRGVRKHPGQSWIQIKNQVHIFVMGDRSHPQDIGIYAYLDKLIGRLRELGYLSDLELVMQDVEEEEGERLLHFHSEKLAVAYGIISTPCGMPIRIMKNLRICNDCHNFMKYTSQLLGREIIVRDIYRFHNFKLGHCSCGDYW